MTLTPIYANVLPYFLVFLVPVLSFGIGIVLPPLFVSLTTDELIYKKNDLHLSFAYTLSVTLTAIVNLIVWQTSIFKNLYYEWDRFLLPYTLLWHEKPFITETDTTSWLKEGLTQAGLSRVWLLMVVLNYTVAGLITYFFYYKKNAKVKRKLITWSTILTLISALSLILLS